MPSSTISRASQMERQAFHRADSGETAAVSHSRMHGSDRFWEGPETRMTLFAWKSHEDAGRGGLIRGSDVQRGGKESRRSPQPWTEGTKENLHHCRSYTSQGSVKNGGRPREDLFWFSAFH
uniref:Uncharacterized protein n=1 Tax=Mus musculus TaxID=10090 RepID=Q8C9M5_MOUSE|nr:unnamed protein product [Mus musculus]